MQLSTFLTHVTEASRQSGLSLSETAERCIKTGIVGLDVEMNQFTECHGQLETLFECGMKLNSIPVRCDFFHNPQDFSLCDMALELTCKYNGSALLAIPGYLQEGDNERQCLENCIEPMKKLVGKAGEYGIEVGMEDYDNVLYPYGRQNVLLWFMRQVDGLSCIFDTGNFAFYGEDTLSAYSLLKPYIKGHIHCKDRAGTQRRKGECSMPDIDGKPLFPSEVGYGEMPIKPIVTDLIKNGFDGYITLEFFGSENYLSDLESSAEFLHSIENSLKKS